MSWANGSTQRRIAKDRLHRKAIRKQKQHLFSLKSDKELRKIMLGSRHIKVKS